MERFMKAAYRAYEIHHQKTPTLDYFFINANYALHKVKFADILYIEGLKDYVQIYIEGQKRPLISKNTLKSIEQKLPTRDFERVHRSYIVNLARIDKIKGNKLYLGNTEIPISEHSIEALLKTVGYER
jgi:two-component system, LytTR family, response regulator